MFEVTWVTFEVVLEIELEVVELEDMDVDDVVREPEMDSMAEVVEVEEVIAQLITAV